MLTEAFLSFITLATYVDQVVNSLCFLSLVLRFVPHDALSFSHVSPAPGMRLALRA